MGIVKKNKMTIPLTESAIVDESFFRQVQMKGDKVLKKYKAQYEETKEKMYSSVTAEGMFASYKIESRQQDLIRLEGGGELPSSMLFRVLQKSEEVVACAVTLKGYDRLEREESDFMKAFFYDGWGTALVGSASSWIKRQIESELKKEGLFSTCLWSPGQHNVDIKLQKVLFHLLNPEEIGITLNDRCMMHPKKSISNFFGIGEDSDIEQIRACDFCELRESCPSAYRNVG